MTLPIVQFFASKITGQDSENRPMFTSIPTSTYGGSTRARIGSSDNFDARLFWLRFEQSPELVGTLSIPITDIIGDRPLWTKPDGSPLSKKKRIEAEKFWRGNRGKETVKAHLFDAFLTGDGYIWKGQPSSKDIMSAVKEVLKQKDFTMNKFQMKELLVKTSQDEDLKRTKKFDYVPSAGVRIIHDEYEIIGYEQEANGLVSSFKPEEIIHYRYLTLNGKVNGFTPIKSLVTELLLLNLVKGNMLSFLENGGSPDKVFVLPKEVANSKNHQFLVDQLRKYKKIQNRHGNLVFTGEIDIQDIQGTPKDLEYKDLALYITSNIAFAYGIPVTRVPYLIGSSASGDSGGLAESGYWNKISDFQDSVEDLLNSQMFNELGWAIKFNRKYKNDEVKESQIESMHADSVIKFQQIFEKQGKQLKMDKLLELMNWNEEDIEQLSMEANPLMNNPLQNQNMLSNGDVQNEDDKKHKNNVKRNSANESKVSESNSIP